MKMDKKNTASAVAKMFPVAMNRVSHSWIAVAVVLPASVVLLYASACMARAKHSSHARIRAGWRNECFIYTVDCHLVDPCELFGELLHDLFRVACQNILHLIATGIECHN